MRRVPAISSKDKPPCFGKHPSIVFEGCSSCARRVGCFRAFSTPGVTVLPFASLRINIAKAGDRRATDVLLHGLDPALWGALQTVCVKHGLKLTARTKRRYRARARDKERRTVFTVVRLDSRRVLIEFLRADVSTAISLGCYRRTAKNRRTPYQCLDIPGDTDNLTVVMAQKLDKLLSMSYLAGTFVPGTRRARTS